MDGQTDRQMDRLMDRWMGESCCKLATLPAKRKITVHTRVFEAWAKLAQNG